MPAAKGLERGVGIHVDNRRYHALADDFGEFLPGSRNQLQVHHVRHQAAGLRVRNLHRLVRLSQDGGAFRHEVDPAEDDETCLLTIRGLPGEGEGITPHVPQGDDFLPLVVVGENEKLLPQGGFPGQDLLHQGRFIQGRDLFRWSRVLMTFFLKKLWLHN